MYNKNLIIFVGILIIFDIIFLGLYFSSVFGQPFKQAEIGFVSKVIDGDTVIINGESVRLLGIDSDERGYPCYNEAKKRLEEIVLDKEVLLEKGNEDMDKYNRRLRYIFLKGSEKSVNLKLVEEGLAIARFPQESKYKLEIVNAEKNARNNKIGCKWIKFY